MGRLGARIGAPALLVFLAACGGAGAPAPPEIQYGFEECGFCRMIVSEEKFAGAVVDAAGVATAFDDLGCLLESLHQQPSDGGRIWVHDYAAGGWIAAEDGVFVRDPDGSTPMGSGLVAFSSRDAAAAFARDRGVDAMAWSALEERSVPVPLP